ncbi:DHA2 family efflux MFS transporter permease subunit [Fructilactobacillus frigidiflavus]|uniref:DHA2 family efflux MFS transporter permease subunit n=1 Tax=Fructilactobacillus frigidiflavus TaxID=3242688 RepID=UPI00375848DC
MKSQKSSIILFAMCLGIFIVMLDTTIMNIALPEIQTSLHTNLTNISWALNAYTIIFAATCIPLGKLANVYGKKPFYLAALLIFILGSSVSGISQNIVILIIGRILQSFGAAILFPLSMDLGLSTQPTTLKNKATLFMGITQGAAAALGPTIGGFITEYLGWRAIFLINLPIGIVSLLICWIYLPKNIEKESTKIDWLGSGLAIVGLFSLTMALIQVRFWGLDYRILLLTVIFIISALLFYFWEKHTSVPMIDFKLFTNGNFNLSAISTLFSQLLLVGFMVIMPTFFTNLFNKTAFESALLITPASLMIFILSPMAGLLISKINSKYLLSLGFVCLGLGYLGLSTLTNSMNYSMYLIYCCLIGAGYGLLVGPISVLSTAEFTGSQLTASQSVIGVLRQLGTVLAVAIFVSCLNFNLATAKQQSLKIVHYKINKIQDSVSTKNRIIKQFQVQLNQQPKAQSHKNQSAIIMNKQDKLVEQKYQQYLSANHLPNNLPSEIQSKIKTKISKLVHIRLLNIMTVVKNLQREIKQSYVKAFTNLYLYAAPFSFILAILIFFLPIKPLRSKKHEK